MQLKMDLKAEHFRLITINKNSSGDEIANVNFFMTTSYNTSKYNPLLNIQHDAGRALRVGVASWY